MHRSGKLIATGVLLIVFISDPVTGRQKPPLTDQPPRAAPDPLSQLMKEQGYVAVPLVQEEAGGAFVVECQSGTEKWRMLLDTGAESSCLDAGLAKRLGLKGQGEAKVVGAAGVQVGAQVSLRGMTIGEYDTRAMGNEVGLAAFDFSAMAAVQEQRKIPKIDGLLGHAALRLNSAVIDYDTRTLYLRTPLRGLWPKVEGRWTATRGEEDGRARAIDPESPPRLEFKDRQFRLTDGARSYQLGVHVVPDKGRYVMAFFDPAQELARELAYTRGGLLKMDGDRLTVCVSLDTATAQGLPDDFRTSPKSGRLLLEFKREK
ncbi:aspartyl protease family protein [Limnoglobus roseus]|uniref:TIGR03067 domain-containing protein n=1 Tax=Limnoglobus roseus TaxID=2598579 RepID=A0A5C1AGB8_9BACT|nr:aspartyl protease family protein [Limnoglobus roseus]QEL17675.1 TIGR03067 domain-containing protein [Limnoglobus roseus]